MNVLLCIWLACASLLGQDQSAEQTPAAAALQAAPGGDAVQPASTEPANPDKPPEKGADVAAPADGTAAKGAPATTDEGGETGALVAPPAGGAKNAPPANPAESPKGSPPGTSAGALKEVVKTSSWEGFLTLLGVVALLVGPFVLARLICQALRLKEFSFRMGVVLFAITLGLAPFLNVIRHGKSWKEAIRLGIDLAGGSNIVFEVDKATAKSLEKEVTSANMDKVVSAVGRRINPGGTEEITVRRVGSDRIEVIIPKATEDQIAGVKRRIVDLGSLEFDIVANIHDHADIIARAEPTRNNPNVTEFRDSANRVIAKWRPVAHKPKPRDDEMKTVEGDPDHAQPREVERNGKKYKEFLLVVEPRPEQRVTGLNLNSAVSGISEQGPCVNFNFNQRGGYLFSLLTSKYQPRPNSHHCRLAILLNEEIQSAPTINAVIGSSGQITGDFDQQELDELIGVLNAGALEVPLKREPVNEYTVSPLLGADVQTKGYTAMVLSLISVYVVMLSYYWKLGLIASLCMTVNVILLGGIMSLINATLTLPGLAGVVLTIGMSVDANVLIYERFREEKAKGSSLRMTIHNGFHKAFGTIVDSHVTTLITSVVLYVVGTEQIRGFAVSLFIGIVVSLFTALYMGRLLFDIGERKRLLTDVKMMQAIKETHFAFSSQTKTLGIISCSLILAGLALFGYRGKENLDIDFRGGSMATITFEGKSPTTEEIQKLLDPKFGETVAIEELQTSDKRTLVRIRSTKDTEGEVSRLVSEGFAGTEYKLTRQEVTIGTPSPIATESGGDFAGGQSMPLALKAPSSAIAVKGAIVDLLGELKSADGKPKYADAESVIEVKTAEDAERSTELTVLTKPAVAAEDVNAVLAAYEQVTETRPRFEELNTFDQAVAGETQWVAVTAIAISMLATIAYLWFRFQAVDFGLAAVIAVLFDILAVLGLCTAASVVASTPVGKSLGLMDFKMNLSMIAAYLTIVGYSLNDKIVVFDRIRELRGKSPTVSTQLVDSALNQTLSRTLLTGVTTLIVIFIMYSLGGEGLKGFSFCLFMGIVVGTYSSIFVASPVLVWLMNRKRDAAARAAMAPMRVAAASQR
jgi:SecD/SecF fusion protein